MTKLAQPTRGTLLFDGDSTLVNYIGEASFKVAVTEPFWRIRRISYSGSSLSIQFADGDDEFDNIWDDRTSLTYS